jgi:SAM-dependent methyltransferase
MHSIFYYCTKDKCRSRLNEIENGVVCEKGHFFPFMEKFNIPIFFKEEIYSTDYSHAQSVEFHDNSFEWVFKTFNSNNEKLRESLIEKLNIQTGQNILVTGIGSGHDLPFIIKKLGASGSIFGVEISEFMLEYCAIDFLDNKFKNKINIHLSCCDATTLPFQDKIFDAAYHFGGINLFSSIKSGIEEMVRVVKPGGKVLIADEGIAPWLKNSDIGMMLIRNNPLMNFSPPLELIPLNVKDVNLSWVLENSFYVIDFTVSDKPPEINIDVEHKGSRGGTMRKRFYGQLEGISPELRDRVYKTAEEKGISKVEYLETVLAKSLEK